ncbi:MAG: transcriptional repressor [Defluviitaleaceae bacterium]|nr:transcriptional repressor [Defluviitaleaceae bacterium]
MNAQRNTIQRKIVLDALRNRDDHPTIDDLYVSISKDYPTISKTTIYRNLRVLAESGQVVRVSLPEGPERYDGHFTPHYHFQCKSCNYIYDMDMPRVEGLDAQISAQYNFIVDDHDITFKGICDKCK